MSVEAALHALDEACLVKLGHMNAIVTKPNRMPTPFVNMAFAAQANAKTSQRSEATKLPM